MDMSMMPPWAQTGLAYASVLIVALTMLANFLDWAVPKLRALAPNEKEARVLTALDHIAIGLTTGLALVHRLVPRLSIVDAPTVVPSADQAAAAPTMPTFAPPATPTLAPVAPSTQTSPPTQPSTAAPTMAPPPMNATVMLAAPGAPPSTPDSTRGPTSTS